MYQESDNWVRCMDDAMGSYNWYGTPNLAGYSPFEMVFNRKPYINPSIELKPCAPILATYRDYKKSLDRSSSRLLKCLHKFWDSRHDLQNKDKDLHGFQTGEIVYLYLPSGAALQTGTRKIRCKFVGPLVIKETISPTQFRLKSLDGEVFKRLVEETRLKPGVIRTSLGNVNNIKDLRKVVRGEKLNMYK